MQPLPRLLPSSGLSNKLSLRSSFHPISIHCSLGLFISYCANLILCVLVTFAMLSDHMALVWRNLLVTVHRDRSSFFSGGAQAVMQLSFWFLGWHVANAVFIFCNTYTDWVWAPVTKIRLCLCTSNKCLTEFHSLTVIWNPWSEFAKEIPDFGDDEFPNMVCVEAGRVATPIMLLPGTAFEASQILQVRFCFTASSFARLRHLAHDQPMRFITLSMATQPGTFLSTELIILFFFSKKLVKTGLAPTVAIEATTL